VRDFGAIGDNLHDDTAAIQAAFDAAFGPASAPHGDSAYLNRPVYIPPGRYKITSPLLLTRVKGGVIYGAGMKHSILNSSGPFSGNTVPHADQTITPLLMTNGLAYSRIEGLTFNIADNKSACIYLFGNYSTSPNEFVDLFCINATCGILAGWMSPNNVSECV